MVYKRTITLASGAD